MWKSFSILVEIGQHVHPIVTCRRKIRFYLLHLRERERVGEKERKKTYACPVYTAPHSKQKFPLARLLDESIDGRFRLKFSQGDC